MHTASSIEAYTTAKPNTIFSMESSQTLPYRLNMQLRDSKPPMPKEEPVAEWNTHLSLAGGFGTLRRDNKRARSQPGTLRTSDPSRLQIQCTMRGQSKELCKLYDGIHTGLSALLKATQSIHDANGRGCLSLYSTCLKSVPDYIREEEYWEKVEKPDVDPDISSFIYSDLEATTSGSGRKLLRDIVRAHGTNVLRTAIMDGLVPTSVASVLVDLCISLGAHSEAQSILKTMISLHLSRARYKTDKEDFDDHIRVVENVCLLSEKTGNLGFLYRQLTILMESELQWALSHNSLRVSLSGAVQFVIEGDDYTAEAATFIRTVIRQSYVTLNLELSPYIQKLRLHIRSKWRRPMLRPVASREHATERGPTLSDTIYDKTGSVRVDQTDLANLLAVLSAVSIIQGGSIGTDSNIERSPAAALIHEMALEAQQSLEIVSNATVSTASIVDRRALILPLLADAIVTTVSDKSRLKESSAASLDILTLSGLPLEESLVDEAGSFMCMIALFYGQATCSDGFEFLKHAIERLATRSKSAAASRPMQSLLDRLIMAAAFAFSQDSNQPSHLDWALNLEQATCVKGEATPRPSLEQTPARAIAQARNGYKWEEGICEWIAKTPAMEIRRFSLPSSSDAGSDDDMPEATSTPRTSPERDLAPRMSFSPCVKGRRMVDLSKRTRINDCVSPTCSSVIVGRRQVSNKRRLSISKRLSGASEAASLASEAFQTGGVYGGDTDELCTAQSVKLVRMWRHAQTICSFEPKEQRHGKTIPLIGRRLKKVVIAHDGYGIEDSDTQDELSFS